MRGQGRSRWLGPALLALLAAGGCGRSEAPPAASQPASPGVAPESTSNASVAPDTQGYLRLPVERAQAGRASAPPRVVPPPSAPIVVRATVPAHPETVPGYDHDLPVEDLPMVAERAAPRYPEAARRAGIQGVVVTRALVLGDLTVGEVRVVQSIPELDQAAIECVRQWRFIPARAKNAPLPVWVGVPIIFSLP